MVKRFSSPALLTLKTNFTITPLILPTAGHVGEKKQHGIPRSAPTGSSTCSPSLHCEPSGDPEAPRQCYCEFLVCAILAHAPAGFELLFLFVFLLHHSPSLSPDRIMLPGNPLPLLETTSIFHSRALFLTVNVESESAPAGGELQPWRDPCPVSGDRQRRDRRGEAPTLTTGPRRRGCLLNSNGIILFGR